MWDATRRSDWRATLVAVNDNGGCRYSTMWNSGINTIVLAADENQLFLTVAATPLTILEAACRAGSTIMVEARKRS